MRHMLIASLGLYDYRLNTRETRTPAAEEEEEERIKPKRILGSRRGGRVVGSVGVACTLWCAHPHSFITLARAGRTATKRRFLLFFFSRQTRSQSHASLCISAACWLLQRGVNIRVRRRRGAATLMLQRQRQPDELKYPYLPNALLFYFARPRLLFGLDESS